MRSATLKELECLCTNGKTAEEKKLIREMSRRLDALRRYDQHFSAADWRPRRHGTNFKEE